MKLRSSALRLCAVVPQLWLALLLPSVAWARVENATEFAPSAGMVQPAERPLRDEICLNGAWQFQPVAVGERPGADPPPLPEPAAGWDAVPLKVPSPWNVNRWGTGPDSGPGTGHPYWPTSRFFPSYPAAWETAQAGWLRRSFRVPWVGKRTVLHFDAVAGDCQVRVNGRVAGTHFDSYTPFELDVTDLLRPGANEVLVGVRDHHLFDVRSEAYPKMHAPYPVGSETERLCGIWQDVFLLGLPPVHVADVFVRPDVGRGELAVDVTVRNDTDRPQVMQVTCDVRPSVLDGIDRGQSTSHLGETVLALHPTVANVPPHATATVTLATTDVRSLKPWSPAAPNLYATVTTLRALDGPAVIDVKQARFGWRQWTIDGPDLKLNGQKIQLVGDLLHPFGPFTLSPRYAWGWYTLVKDFGGNAVRLHAQPMPRFYLDLADEMGVTVLDETAIFGSSVAMNFEPAEAWQRFADHVDGLVLRDRNHPAVMGWSIGNELFAIFELNHVKPADADRWYGRLAELGTRVKRLDPTRPWISCDGDEDLRGTLPVYGKHFGLGLPDTERLPANGKPLMVGESGGSYYAKPKQLAAFNGDRAYASYAGRNEALGVDLFDNITHLAKPRLAYFSASETAWFGVEPLPFGYSDFSRLPTADDGVWFTAPFVDGKPGIQLEHLPPYVATINPGWDPSLPLYRPLAMFEAEKAALAGQPSPYDHRTTTPHPAPPRPSIDRVSFVGSRAGRLYRRLLDWGVPVVDGSAAPLTIVDGDTAAVPATPTSGLTLVLLSDRVPAGLDVTLTDRPATALVPRPDDPRTASFSLADLYFAEGPPDERHILRHGLAGPWVDAGRVLLRASDTDWSQFNDVPEVAKCGAAALYERVRKPAGAALVIDAGGHLAVCSIDATMAAGPADAMWRELFTNLGVKLGPGRAVLAAAFDDQGALVTARVSSRLAATAAWADDLPCAELHAVGHDRFLLDRVGPPGAVPAAIFVSYWVNSPRALDDVLAGGPDVPRYDVTLYVADRAELSLNGRPVPPVRSEPADYRTKLDYDGLPLRRGWNHVVVKVTVSGSDPAKPATLAVRAHSADPKFLASLETAATAPPGGGGR